MTTPTWRPFACVPIPVRWRDLDGFKHVNNAVYQTYLEQARFTWTRQLEGSWYNEHLVPVMAACHLNYRRPITWPADITVELATQRIGTKSLTIDHRIIATAAPDVIYCDGYVVIVWMDPSTGKGVPLPPAIVEAAST